MFFNVNKKPSHSQLSVKVSRVRWLRMLLSSTLAIPSTPPQPIRSRRIIIRCKAAIMLKTAFIM